MTKVPISGYQKRSKRKDVARNEELVLAAFLTLEQRNKKRPTQIQVADEIGLSRKVVGRYFKSLNL